MSLFRKAKKAPSANEAITQLRDTITTLEKREAFLQRKATQEGEQATSFIRAKNRKSAMMCLKRKKTYEAQIDKINGARMTIEQQVFAIESADTNLLALKNMQVGAQALKNIHKSMTPDDVEDTMDEIRDQMEIATDISNAISQPIGAAEAFDETELENELEQLEQQALDEQLAAVDEIPVKLPPVPTATPTPAKRKEEDELAALERSMAL
ncbi:Snf7 family [Pelomyxa schiedti]|nr:Snf7 family [Pelomyxa schiedti]